MITNIKFINRTLLISFIAIISFAMHFKHFSKDLMSIHVWRQAQTQTTIVNFYEEDLNIFNPRQNNRGDGDGIFRMEFPLMQWLIAVSCKIFGNHLIITRIFMFLFGLFTIAGIYELVLQIFNKKLPAMIAAWAFSFSPGFYYYTINPLPDNFALCCSVWGLAFFFFWVRKRASYLLLLSGLLLSLGALSKLPFILYFVVPWMYFILPVLRKEREKRNLVDALILSVFIVLPAAWYAWVIPQWSGNNIIMGIMKNRPPFITTLDYLQFNLVSSLPELLLGYGSLLFFIAGFYFLFRNRVFRKKMFPVFLFWGLAILAYFLFEINMIGKIHDYYLFPFYPLLFILVGYGADHLIRSEYRILKYLSYILLVAIPFICYARMQGRWDVDSPGFNKDLLTYKHELRDAVPKDALCVAGNDESQMIFFYYIDKKGWTFTKDELGSDRLEDMIDKGARFLYCDSRVVDESPETIPYLDRLISEKGTVRIYSLKKKQDPEIQ